MLEALPNIRCAGYYLSVCGKHIKRDVINERESICALQVSGEIHDTYTSRWTQSTR